MRAASIRFFVLSVLLLTAAPAFAQADSAEVEALNKEGVTLLMQGKNQEAIAVFEKMLALDPGNNTAAYNLACAYALSKLPDQALEWLGKAVKLGYADYNWAMQDGDLASIRNDPRFAEALAPIAPQPAPDFTLKDLEGHEVSLSDFRGKVVLLDFWGTWCGWCVKAIPDLKKSYSDHKDEGFVILGITYEFGEPEASMKKLEKFVKDQGMDWPILIGDEATKEAFGGIKGFPTSILITHDGKIHAKIVGYTEPRTMEEQIHKLLELRDGARDPAETGAESLTRGKELAASDNPTQRWHGAESLAASGSIESLPELIRLLGDPVPWIREGTIGILRKLTGQDLGFAHAAPPADREAAVARWTEWYEGRKDKLVFDKTDGKFLVLH